MVKIVVLGIMAITANVVPLPASAQSGFPAPSPEIIVWSARACYAEATWSVADCSALLHVIRKRAAKAKWPFLKMLKKYSIDNWIQSTHGKHASTLRLSGNKHQSEKWNQKWQELVSHVVAIFSVGVVDPCPHADHWAATYYRPRSPMRRVRCLEKVANAFWVSVPG